MINAQLEQAAVKASPLQEEVIHYQILTKAPKIENEAIKFEMSESNFSFLMHRKVRMDRQMNYALY